LGGKPVNSSELQFAQQLRQYKIINSNKENPGKETKTITFGLMHPHLAKKKVDSYHKELHDKDFNLNFFSSNLPPRHKKRQK